MKTLVRFNPESNGNSFYPPERAKEVAVLRVVFLASVQTGGGGGGGGVMAFGM